MLGTDGTVLWTPTVDVAMLGSSRAGTDLGLLLDVKSLFNKSLTFILLFLFSVKPKYN